MARYSIPTRFWIWCLAFTATALAFVLTSTMSIAILAMQKTEGLDQPDFGPRYAYTPYEQSTILGSFSVGAAIGCLPLGLAIDRFDIVRWYMLGGFGLAAALMLLVPMIAWSVPLLMTVRLLTGFTQTAIYPAMHKMFSRWAPLDEMGKFTFAATGGNLGTICTFAISGVLIESIGWQWTFYVSALALVTYSAAWWFHGYPTPAQHPRIRAAEREHIEQSRRHVMRKKTPLPLRRIITSVPVLSLCILQFANMWGFMFLVISAPKYVFEVLGFTISSTGFLSSVPYICRIVGGYLFAQLNDHLFSINWLSKMNRRRIFCVCSHIIPGLVLAALPFAGTNPYVSIALMTLAYGFNGAVTQTSFTNNHDLSPNYAASILSIANALGSTSGFISPLIVTYFTVDQDVYEGWRNVFLLGAVIYIVPALFFMCFGSASVQSWDSDENTDNELKQTDDVIDPLHSKSDLA